MKFSQKSEINSKRIAMYLKKGRDEARKLQLKFKRRKKTKSKLH